MSFGPFPVFGIGTGIIVNLDNPQRDPISFLAEAGKVGLFVQLFVKDGELHARVVGAFDTVTDFQAGLVP